VHVEATPDVIRGWYAEQWKVDDYREFVLGGSRSPPATAAAEL
jgi:hypothetical protein